MRSYNTKYVYDRFGFLIKYDKALSLMDEFIKDEIRQRLGRPVAPQRFYDEYCAAHYKAYGEEFTV